MKYNTDDMAKMQQEAVKRIQEMQNKGKAYTPTVQTLPQSPNARPPDTAVSKTETPPIPQPDNFFEMLFGDKEKSLILLLILLLSSEKKGDTVLIFALIYLLL